MKVILIADTHFDRHTNYPGKAESDIEAFKKVYEYAKDNDIKFVFHLGDLFEKNNYVDASIYGQVYDIISSSKARTIIIPGNHDLYNKKNFNECILRPFGKSLENVGVDDGVYMLHKGKCKIAWVPVIIKFGDYKIALIPYNDKPERIEEQIKKLDQVDYIFGHFGIDGISENIQNSINMSVVNPRKFRKCFLGHYHKRTDTGTYMHIGSFTQRNFGEEGNKTGAMLLDLKKCTYSEIGVGFIKRFRTAGVKDKEEYDMFREMYNKGKFSDYFIRVKYGDDFKKVTRNFDKEIIFSEEKASRKIFDISEKVEQMVREQVKETCTLKNTDKVIERGLDIIKVVTHV